MNTVCVQVLLSFAIVVILEIVVIALIPDDWEFVTCKRIANTTNSILAILIVYWICKLWFMTQK